MVTYDFVLLVLAVFSSSCQFTNGQLFAIRRVRQDIGTPLLHQETSSEEQNTAVDNRNNDEESHDNMDDNERARQTIELIEQRYFNEPSCQELKAMWRFSKRQSRAAEISNEIPTYRDPFAYSQWRPYGGARQVQGYGVSSKYRDLYRPVFGRMINRPVNSDQDSPRTYADSSSRMIGGGGGVGGARGAGGTYRRAQNRFINGNTLIGTANNNAEEKAPASSFDKLKSLMWDERVQDLAEQRRKQQEAVRALTLKDLSMGINKGSYKPTADESVEDSLKLNQQPKQDEKARLTPMSGQKITSVFSSNPASTSQRQGFILPSHTGISKSISRNYGTGRGGINNKLAGSSVPAEAIIKGKSSMATTRLGGPTLTEPFPIRQSHFRERNRDLFRKPSAPLGKFQRHARSDPNILENLKDLLLEAEYELEKQGENQYTDESADKDLSDLDMLAAKEAEGEQEAIYPYFYNYLN